MELSIRYGREDTEWTWLRDLLDMKWQGEGKWGDGEDSSVSGFLEKVTLEKYFT